MRNSTDNLLHKFEDFYERLIPAAANPQEVPFKQLDYKKIMLEAEKQFADHPYKHEVIERVERCLEGYKKYSHITLGGLTSMRFPSEKEAEAFYSIEDAEAFYSIEDAEDSFFLARIFLKVFMYLG